jgi:hypothetical protein
MIVLSGCASVPSGYWERTWEGALTTEFFTIGASPWGPGVQGWTACDKVKRHCQIFIVSTADYDCVKTHELKHAAGLDHPKYRRAFICS